MNRVIRNLLIFVNFSKICKARSGFLLSTNLTVRLVIVINWSVLSDSLGPKVAPTVLQITTDCKSKSDSNKRKLNSSKTNQLVGGVPWPGPDLPGGGGELRPAGRAVVVVRVVDLTPETQGLTVDDGA